ncbi:plasminogen-like [Tubulanus polymorphus]|uniref:plasminogen-like n=1 Tax=Tubulanus polymorphus TaxID=672921 RepID=UPI003DA1D3C6
MFVDNDLSLTADNCRYVSSSSYPSPWCYTTDHFYRWDHCIIPKCPMSCGMPEPGINAMFVDLSDRYLVGDSVEQNCLSGFVPIDGSDRRTCTETGVFSGKPLHCESAA